LRLAGVDAATFMEFIRLCIKILTSMLVWALVVELAFYVYSVQDFFEVRGGDISPGFLERASLANLEEVPDDGNWTPTQALALITSMLGIWINTIYGIFMLKRSWEKIVSWCKEALEDETDVVSHVVLVRAANPFVKPVTQAEAFATWDMLFPNEIFSVRMIRSTAQLPKLLAKFDRLDKSLTALQARKQKLIDEGKPEKLDKKTCFCMKSINAKIPKTEETIATVREKIAELKPKVCGDDNDKGLSYFVIFHRSRDATVATQTAVLPGHLFEVTTAPVPGGVRWEALKATQIKVKTPLMIAGRAAYYAMLFFYMIPISAVSVAMNLSNLYEILPPLRDFILFIGPAAESFLEALLPPLALTIFMALLPMICMFISSFYGFPSEGQVAANCYGQLFTFNFIYVFLWTSIAGTLLNSIWVILNDPKQILTMLSGGLANQATFFICFVALKTVALLNKELVRLVPTLLLFAKRKLKLVKEDEAPDEPIKFPVVWMAITLKMIIGASYAHIAPFCTIFCLLYMVLGFVLFKRNLVFTYTHKIESRGIYFPSGSNMFTGIMMMAQLLLAAVHAAKKSWPTFGCILPLIYITWRANVYFKSSYIKRMSTLPLADVEEVSRKKGGGLIINTRESVHGDLGDLLGTLYLQPELIHPEISNEARVKQLLHRSSYKAAPAISVATRPKSITCGTPELATTSTADDRAVTINVLPPGPAPANEAPAATAERL